MLAIDVSLGENYRHVILGWGAVVTVGLAPRQADLVKGTASFVDRRVSEDSIWSVLHRECHRLFPDEMFADLFPSGRGRPSVPADVMAAVILLQALQGLSDAETVDAVTFDLRWKAACGLPVTAVGFHPTTLTYWRRRLAGSDRPNRIFDAVREVIARTGALTGRTRRALDSTVLDDAVATQDTVTQLIAAIRRVRRDVPGSAAVVAVHCTAHDYNDPGKPVIAWDDEQARAALVDGLVGDAHRLLGHLPEHELDPKAAEAVALLALVAGQDVEPVDGSDGTDGRWRIARRVAPDRVISVLDPDARHAHKTVSRRQDGFKAHLAVEPETGIITGCQLTKASGPDGHDAVVGVDLLTGEPDGLQVLADSAYGTGEMLAALQAAGHIALVKPWPVNPAVPGGFTVDDFTVAFTEDGQATTLTCPAGITRPVNRVRQVNFGAACRGCPLRPRCTRSATGKSMRIREHDALQRAHRARAASPEFLAVYRQHRPMVERTIAWVTRGNRRLRYRGTTKNDAWLHLRASAINLRRLTVLGLHRDTGTWSLAG